MNPSIRVKKAALLLVVPLVCFGLLLEAQAVVPPPDGGYPNFTTAEGQKALQSLTTGSANTAVGWFSLFSNAGGSFNTATGAGTLLFNTADANTAFGTAALLFNTTGFQNTAVGTAALLNNTIGNGNTATGINALSSNTEGNFNTAIGGAALVNNTTGAGNTATGTLALNANTTGSLNTATGFAALQNNTGTNNTAMGAGALDSNIVGGGNTAVGFSALSNNEFGEENTAIGNGALANNDGTGNVALGTDAGGNVTSGTGNVMLGANAGGAVSTASNVICIGLNVSGANVSNTTWIRNVFGETTIVGTTAPVIVASNGQLGTVSSSLRFKKEVKPMNKASEAILALKPVTFHYKNDAKDTPQFGLIAEEVVEINPDLVVRDKNGEIYSVRYDQVNAMLLNEFLKEHKKVEEQQATIAELKSTVAQQQKGFESKLTKQEKQIEALTAGLQKVSAQLEASKPAPQIVNNQ